MGARSRRGFKRWCAGTTIAACSALIAIAACGGRSASGTSGAEAGVDAGPAVTGPDGCVSESGYLVCRGSRECPSSGECLDCLGNSDATGLCETVAMGTTALGECPLCGDGKVCVRVIDQAPYACLPFDVGQLFAANGSGDRVRYEDWSSWTGQALPAPASCGDGGLPLCGGFCGPCAQGSTCTGRSPAHPYGFCVPSNWSACTRSQPSCAASINSCLIFNDDADAQRLADENGICIPASECTALGSGYPGGATCLGGG